MQRLLAPDLVFPGHPRSDPTPPSPSLSPHEWNALLVRGIRAMEILVARYNADGADFLDGNPKSLLPDLDYLGDRGGRAVYAFAAGSQYYLVNAPGGPGLLEFVDERRRQLGRPAVAPTAVLLTACGAGEMAGLRELVDRCHPRVYAAQAGLADVRRTCPAGTDIRPADELATASGLAVEKVDVAGRGFAPVAYRLATGGKSVLFSGQIPVKLTDETGERLVVDLLRPPGDLRDYFATLTRLHDSAAPDLWLPSIPTNGQNANLYDRQWSREIERNLLMLRSIIARTQEQ